MPEEKTNTVEVVEDAAPEKLITAEVPTRKDLKEKGWSKSELDSAEKRGMIQKPEEKKAEAKAEEPKKAETPPAAEPEKKIESNLPDFTFKSPEQEKVFLDAFGAGTPQRAMYFRMKNERQSRQRAEAERDRLALELQLRKDRDTQFDEKPQPEIDENGNVIDPEDRPLTMKQLKAMNKAEMDKLNKQREELESRSAVVADAMKTQEEYAKSILPDFEDTVTLATDLINNLEQIPEKWKRDKVVKMVKDLQVTAATADKYGVDDYTASMIAYEMGKLHPRYGQKSEPDGATKVDPKANGSLTPEQMKRIEENTQRRASSASLPGSSNGRRVVSVDDITVKDILKMTPDERYKFKKDHPDKMAKLMRG